MKFFRWYQFVVPLVLFPASYLLWLRRYDGDHMLVLFALSIPVVFAYVVPGLGTNWLGLWEFNTRFRLGRFRPHHGFVFGTATSLFGLACVPPSPPGFDPVACARAALVTGSVVGFWNWLYDTYAVKSGFILIHNRLTAQGEPAEVVATDHAPVFFGSFGVCYGIALQLADALSARIRPGVFTTVWISAVIAGVVVPVAAYVASSYLRRGESGLKVYRRQTGGRHEESGTRLAEGVPVDRVRISRPDRTIAEPGPAAQGMGGQHPVQRPGGLD